MSFLNSHRITDSSLTFTKFNTQFSYKVTKIIFSNDLILSLNDGWEYNSEPFFLFPSFILVGISNYIAMTTSCFTESLQLSYPLYITIDTTELKAADRFTYLGCIITSDAKIDKEVNNKLAKASRAFGRLYKYMWYDTYLEKITKIEYRAFILVTLLYSSEMWGTNQYHLWLL